MKVDEDTECYEDFRFNKAFLTHSLTAIGINISDTVMTARERTKNTTLPPFCSRVLPLAGPITSVVFNIGPRYDAATISGMAFTNVPLLNALSSNWSIPLRISDIRTLTEVTSILEFTTAHPSA